MLALTALLVMVSSVLPADEFTHDWCKGRTTEQCIQWALDEYNPDEPHVANRALSELFVVNPGMFLRNAVSRREHFVDWTKDLQVWTFRAVGPSIDAELEEAALVRLRDLMLDAAERYASDPELGELALELRTQLQGTVVQHLE